MSEKLADWLARVLDGPAGDLAGYERALTHGSQGAANYERLEFLGDRVLGLTVAEWLYERFPDEPEGKLSRRFNSLVTGQVCAEVAREIGAPAHLRLGKQARDDGAASSDNVPSGSSGKRAYSHSATVRPSTRSPRNSSRS